MRIISGVHKGRKLIAPLNLPVRPTTDMAKEALFNILGNNFYFDEISVLDLFCGIGSIAFEFASRGCQSVTAVDAHKGCVKFVKSVSDKLDLDIDTVLSDAFKFLYSSRSSWDIIFADPPYDIPEKQFSELAEIVFDFYINAGGNASKLLQRILNDMDKEIPVDGAISKTTMAALEED